MKNFLKETLEELRGDGSKSVRSYSRNSTAKILTSMLNTPDHEVEVTKTKDGKMIVEKVYPVKEARNYLADTFADAFKMNKNEARGTMADYQFKDASALIPVVQETVFHSAYYKKFDMLPRKDFAGGIIIEKVPKTISSYTAPSTGERGKIEKDEHLRIKAKSKVNKWNKRKVK